MFNYLIHETGTIPDIDAGLLQYLNDNDGTFSVTSKPYRYSYDGTTSCIWLLSVGFVNPEPGCVDRLQDEFSELDWEVLRGRSVFCELFNLSASANVLDAWLEYVGQKYPKILCVKTMIGISHNKHNLSRIVVEIFGD